MRFLLLFLLSKLIGARLVTYYYVDYQTETGDWLQFLWWNIPNYAYAREHALGQRAGMYPSLNRIRRRRLLIVDEKVIYQGMSD